ncbi:NAD(P)/FAD-dependent oxidoreductase [Asticcacaulis taihuensis]|uniref:Glycine/D-amino acid oxidase n=1 Tax=Asticcacaulis taihuensis TaxID=260084 RepID=A0A1G4QKE4_9CAUL|nr:FAD-binding oxidoreductase [Asticcacaulis taihuensis]SCW44549.1 Glycine/D-amino acid oxidase [Asticcacaulis taihuensis]
MPKSISANTKTHGLWETTAPAAPETATLAAEIRTSVCIIGGGYTGNSAALHLAKKGVASIVLEAKEIGFGGAGRNVGLVNAGMWVMPDELPNVLGEVHGDRLLKLLGDAPSVVFEIVDQYRIECQLQKHGTLHCGVGQVGLEELQQRETQWRLRGAPVRLLSAEETAEKVGSNAYTGALLDLRAGTIQPLAYVRGLAKAALKEGATIYTGSPALEVTAEGAQWRVKTPQGSVIADWVIMATDAYTSGPWEIIRREQVHLPYFNFATVPLPEDIRATILPGKEGVWDTKEVLSSFRMDIHGRLIFGSVGALKGVGEAIHRDWALRALHKIFPQIGNVAFEAEWYGQIGMTDDNLPRFHKFAPNVIGISGYNGRGIAPGTVMGRTLAELIAGEKGEGDLPLPVTTPAEAKMRALKEVFYEVGAQAAHLTDSRF